MNNEHITNPQVAFQCCKGIAKEIQEPVLRSVALQVLDENKELYLTLKGSDWQHHNYAGGLIVHTCNVALNAVRLGEFYKDSVNIDLIRFGALMHDAGKLFDYNSQTEFNNDNTLSMNQALLGHSLEGVVYISNKLQVEYSKDNISVSKEYVRDAITQASHCIGAHMDNFGACAKQQMFEVLIIGCADKIDAYIEQTIVKDKGKEFTLGTGETFYRASIDATKVKHVEK